MVTVPMMATKRCRRKYTNSALCKSVILFWIAASFSNMSNAFVPVGFATLPPAKRTKLQLKDDAYDETEADPFPNRQSHHKRQPRKPRARMKKSVSSAYSTLLPPPLIGKGSNRRRWATDGPRHGLKSSSEGTKESNSEIQSKNNILSNTPDESLKIPKQVRRPRRRNPRKQTESLRISTRSDNLPSSTESTKDQITDLSEWSDLFSDTSPSQFEIDPNFPSMTPTVVPTPVIEGVLPVSELFYRSTQSISSTDDEDVEGLSEKARALREGKRRRAKSYKNAEIDGETGDDEELPFSAEQSDRLSIPGNKIQIRRNKATDSSLLLDEIATGIGIGLDGNRVPSEAVRRELKSMARQEQAEQRQLNRRLKQQQQQQNMNQAQSNANDKNNTDIDKSSEIPSKSPKSNKRKLREPKVDRTSGRKMVRRGMEMLVGGEPINADPPQRAIELNYLNKHPRLWNRAVTLNSPDFGPFLYMHAAGKISKQEIGLYCENFVHNAQKWNVCPDDLKTMVTENELRIMNENAAAEHASHQVDKSGLNEEVKSAIQSSLAAEGLEVDIDGGIIHDDSGRTIRFNPRELDPPKGFGTPLKRNKKRKESRGGASGIASDIPVLKSYPSKSAYVKSVEDIPKDQMLMFAFGGKLKFSLGVTKTELESGHEHCKAFRNVLREGFGLAINADEMGFDVIIAKLVITDVDGGSTDVEVQFSLEPREAMEIGEAEKMTKDINGRLASAMDDGKMAMALAQMAAEEKGWSSKVRSRVVEEFLFETEDDEEDKDFESDVDDDVEEDESDFTKDDDEAKYDQDELYEGPFGMTGDPTYEKDDHWLGGGNGGVFFDYSESNILNSPYKGALGPCLLDAAAERARQNQPRVIAIGDVHGCIDELKALLRKCDYHPGDIVIFLGDLVCKGPDSLSVVQMAREIGAIGVRGNHDFEVVRWHQAIKSGADPPVIGSEHYYVASALSTADLKWMYTLPWFISSAHLNALFVHAGFVSGIRLAKQNPRLMMNMRSILPDGTVTSKFFNNWPWARLWDGPQTVFFGHDADRGLQQYEHAIGLDTGCVYGGKLTACILPERRLVSVNAKREYFQYRRKHFD